MGAKSKPNPSLPEGLSPDEEARWWDKHDSFWNATDTPDEIVAAQGVNRTKPVNLRLPIEMIEMLKIEAARRSLPYQTLIRFWLRERLNEEAHAKR